MNEEINYERDVTINQDALDVEWLDQPKLTFKYTAHESKCRKELEELKSELDIVSADLDKAIREDPEKFGLPKITETAIRNVITAHPDFKEVQQAVRDAEYELNMAQAAVRSIYAKKDALENLVRLFGQQYFAGPKVPRDLSKEWQTRQNQRSSDRKVKIKRRNK